MISLEPTSSKTSNPTYTSFPLSTLLLTSLPTPITKPLPTLIPTPKLAVLKISDRPWRLTSFHSNCFPINETTGFPSLKLSKDQLEKNHIGLLQSPTLTPTLTTINPLCTILTYPEQTLFTVSNSTYSKWPLPTSLPTSLYTFLWSPLLTSPPTLPPPSQYKLS